MRAILSYGRGVDEVRAALYVDFDNVYSGLVEHDLVAARTFAEEPAVWVKRLEADLGSPHWTHKRCYLNVGGSARNPRTGEPRIPFLPYRRPFADAGFEVIDCPPLTPQRKNAADIRLTVDVMDTLHGPVHVDDFVIASSDSDFTPLLLRLRAADRTTTLVSTFDPVPALTSVATLHVDRRAFMELLIGGGAPPARGDRTTDPQGWAAFALAVRQEYEQASQPLVLSELGKRLRRRLAGQLPGDGWFGHATLTKALRDLDIPTMAISSHHVWDRTRHRAP